MQESALMKTEEVKYGPIKQSEEHILDRLDRLNKSKGLMDEKWRQNEIKIIYQLLKEMILESYKEAYNHSDEKFRIRWRLAMKKDFFDMERRGVWKVIKRSEVPKGRRCIKCKWVFDVKRDGRFRARLVACGYSQIPGVDFVESYALVINDITWRILLIMMISKGYDARIVDVETAFLHGDLDEEIYMNCPPGLSSKEDECLFLLKTIYGLVQAARQYYKKFTKALIEKGYEGGLVDPCLMMKKFKNKQLYLSIHVDDSLVIGPKWAIDRFFEDLKESGFGVTVESDLTDYLSCR